MEGDPDSPISRGRLCPKGAASKNLVTSATRQTRVRYRRPHGTEWEDLDLDTAMHMIADRVIETRRSVGGKPSRGESLQHPRCVFQVPGGTTPATSPPSLGPGSWGPTRLRNMASRVQHPCN
jgi:formate dehydrogenase major subunit